MLETVQGTQGEKEKVLYCTDCKNFKYGNHVGMKVIENIHMQEITQGFSGLGLVQVFQV